MEMAKAIFSHLSLWCFSLKCCKVCKQKKKIMKCAITSTLVTESILLLGFVATSWPRRGQQQPRLQSLPAFPKLCSSLPRWEFEPAKSLERNAVASERQIPVGWGSNTLLTRKTTCSQHESKKGKLVLNKQCRSMGVRVAIILDFCYWSSLC